MGLTDKVNADIAAAMKARDAGRLSALRMVKAAIMNKGVEKGRDLDDAEVQQVVASLVKQRRDSIDQFAKAGRTDLVDKETREIGVLNEYLRPAASAEDIADMLGCTRPTLTQVLNDFARAGAIDIARKRIVIVDPLRLGSRTVA